MEIIIGIAIGTIIAMAANKRKKNRNQPVSTETPAQRKLRQTDEHITVILPTIDNK